MAKKVSESFFTLTIFGFKNQNGKLTGILLERDWRDQVGLGMGPMVRQITNHKSQMRPMVGVKIFLG